MKTLDVIKDTFYYETIDGYQKGRFPHHFFDVSVRKRRIKTLIEHIVLEVEQLDPIDIYNSINWGWMVKHRLDKVVKYLDNENHESRIENGRSLLRYAFPELPETKFEDKVVGLYNEILSGDKKTFPNDYFGNDYRIFVIYKYVYINLLSKDPVKDSPLTKEQMVEYKLHKFAKQVDFIHKTTFKNY